MGKTMQRMKSLLVALWARQQQLVIWMLGGVLCCCTWGSVSGQSVEGAADVRVPDIQDFAYGPHSRQVLDFYRADSKETTPVIVHIHGGGWVRGDKQNVPALRNYLDAGISVVSINYRFVWQAQKQGIQPPVAWPLADAVRAVQTVRSQAGAWGLDKQRVAATGNSAGACSSLYLAFHDDFALPNSSDPVERESSRLTCAAVYGAQTTLDPAQMRAWIPNSVYGGHAFGFMDPDNLDSRDQSFELFLNSRESILTWIVQYSPWELVSSDDPPIYLFFKSPPSSDPKAPDPTHSAQFGVHLQRRCRDVGVECELAYPGSTENEYQDMTSFLIAALGSDS